MKKFSKEQVEELKRIYTNGIKIRLINMNDIQAVPSGTVGTVRCVDDIGTIHMEWESGSSLGLIYGVDKFEVVKTK